MKKSFTILMALVITFFTVPFGGITAQADEKVYNDIEDGVYSIGVKAIEKNSEKVSAADGFLLNKATLSIEGNEITLMFGYKKSEGPMGYTIDWTKLEENNPVADDTDDLADYYTFKVDELKSIYGASMNYKVPALGMDHDVDYRVVLDEGDLNNLPVKEETEEAVEPETPEEPEETENPGESEQPEIPEESEDESEESKTENEEESVIELDNGSYTIDVSYLHAEEEKDSAMARYMDSPIFLTVDDDKVELTITVNDHNTVTKLQVDGKDSTVAKLDGNKRYETFEFDSLDSVLNGYVEYQAPFQGSIHYGKATFRILLDADSSNPAEASDKPGADINEPVETEVELNKPIDVQKDKVINIKNDKNTQLKMPDNLPEGVKVEITSVKENIKNQGNLVVAGEVYEFDFSGIEHFEGVFELVMGYDVDKYAPNQVAIYYYDEEKAEWIKQDSKVENGTITINPTHFSTYGVFALDLDSDETGEGTEDEKSEKINYTVKHATKDEASAADMFFTKPATLFEKDGEKYIQLTVKSWSMIDWLRTDQGDVAIVKTNDDGSVVIQFKVDGPLTDAILLSMSVTVPGVYEGMIHDARLFLDVDEGGNGGTPIPVPTPTPAPKPVPKPKAEEKSEIVPAKVYEIDYVVKHATEDKESAANSFFRKPAHLLYIDGEKYIQLTINDWNMIDWLRTEHGDIIVVKENDDGSALIQFKLDGDLSDEILLSMKVTVPGLYSMEHDARLIFDVESQKEIDANNFQIVIDKEGSDPGPEGTEDPKGPGKPEFGNGETTKKNIDGAVKSGKTNNPQTGDTTSIFLYALLLMGSLVPLAVKLRRRFV